MDQFETAKALFFEGLRSLETEDFLAAETKFTQALELVPGRASSLINLSAVKLRLEKFAEAEALARQALALAEPSPEAWANLGSVLTATERHAEAVAAYDRALLGNATNAQTWLNQAMSLLALKNCDDALLACNESLKLKPDQHQAVHTQSLILQELKRTDEARKIYQRSLELRLAVSPVTSGVRRATQTAEVLIIQPNRYQDDALLDLAALHGQVGNYAGQLAEQLADEFHFNFVFTDDATRPAAREKIPPPDLVVNNHANADLIHAEGGLPGLTALVDSFGVPVVNHPTKVAANTRDATAKLLENIPGLLVPKTRRFFTDGILREDLIHEIESHFDYPLITRTLTLQRGVGMSKVDSRAVLAELLGQANCPKEFFVTQFFERPTDAQFYRKIRAAVVRDDIVIVRVDYHTFWNVHGRRNIKRVPFYLERTYLLDWEKQICANPEAELGRPAMSALRALRERLPLDVFGVDFEVNADGALIFFEANASMNLLSTAQKEVPNPTEPNDRLRSLFQSYLKSLAGRR